MRIFFLIIFLILSIFAKDIKPFHWIDGDDYPPFIYLDRKNRPAGIFYEIMKEAFKRLNIPLKIDLYPWSRAQKFVKLGYGDGMVTVYTKKRALFTKASIPIVIVPELIITNKNNPKLNQILQIHTLKDLKPFVIAETIGSGWTKNVLKNNNIIWVPDLHNIFYLLLKNRADVYIGNYYFVCYFLKKEIEKNSVYKQIIINPNPVAKITFRLLIQNKSPYISIIDKFNKIIEEMKKDGTIKSIIKKYECKHLLKRS